MRFPFLKRQKLATPESQPGGSGLSASEDPLQAPSGIAEEVRLINDCNHLPLPVFISAITSGNYSGLILSGEPTDAQIREAWEAILTQYTDLSATESGQAEITQSASLRAAWNRLDRINAMLGIAAILGDESILKVLEDEGYGLTLCGEAESDDTQLRLAATRLKSEMVRLQIQSAQSSGKEPEGQGEKTPLSEDFFYEALVSVSEMVGMHLQADKLTTAEFCRYFRRLCSEIERRNRMTLKQQENGSK